MNDERGRINGRRNGVGQKVKKPSETRDKHTSFPVAGIGASAGSTIEELETANDKLRSSNEELNTLNEELQQRNCDLTQANNDILNLLGSMNLTVMIVDRRLRIRHFTPMAQRTLQLVSADVGRSLQEIRTPLGLAGIRRQIRTTIKTLKPFEADLRDHTGRLYTVQLHPYVTSENKVDGAVIALTDVSAAEERFQIVADLLPEAVAYVGPDNRYVFANSIFEKWFRFSSERVRGMPVQKVQGKKIYRCLRASIATALAGESSEFEGHLVYRRAGRRYVHIDYVPRRDANNKTIGYYSVKRDLTDLKDAEEKFRVFVETAPQAIIIHDPRGKVMVVNAQAERMFGYPREEMLGKSLAFLIPERFLRKHVNERRQYTRNPVVRPIGIGLELSARRKDGTEFPVEISLSPIQTSNGTLVSSTIVDLTDRRRLAEQTHLATVLEERSRLARDVHDTLAQGFTGVILNLEAIEETAKQLDPAVRTRIQKARDLAREKLAEARRSLLALSAPHKGVGDLTKQLRELADGEKRTGSTRVGFSLRGAPRSLNGAVEENLVFIARQAVDNAQQHAHAKAIRVEIIFNKKRVALRVRDNGRGFDPTRASRGLGLGNMRDRAHYIGATFSLRTRIGDGTLVVVSVPFPRALKTTS